MKYMGSKSRIAKYIIPIMESYRKPNQLWWEPFVGGGNSIQDVKGPRLGTDINSYVIDLLKAVRDGWIPPNYVSEKDYYHVKQYPFLYDSHHYAFVALCCSYSGKFWGGYARGKTNNGIERNYADEQSRHLTKQGLKLQECVLEHADYYDVTLLKTSSPALIYCDPPYKSTTTYKDKFNHEKFWEWATHQYQNGHTIFVSEYEAPSNWKCIWSKEICSSLTKETGNKKGIEKLWVINN